MPDAIRIRNLESLGEREIRGLSDVLIDYALRPDGTLCATTLFFKFLRA